MIDRSTNRRLQLATRIHYALLRAIGIGIDVGRLLKHPLYARDVLLVCEACDGHDLRRLAVAFRAAVSSDVAAAGANTSVAGTLHIAAEGVSSFGLSLTIRGTAPTGTATTIRPGSSFSTAVTAASMLAPVARPSSTRTTTLPRRSSGRRSPR